MPALLKPRFAILILLAFLLLASTALAADSYNLSWWTADSGGGTSSGGSYTLSGTIGQPDAGVVAIGGGYTLAGGFWHGGEAAAPPEEMRIYLPVVIK
jgi:hypothetical protein